MEDTEINNSTRLRNPSNLSISKIYSISLDPNHYIDNINDGHNGEQPIQINEFKKQSKQTFIAIDVYVVNFLDLYIVEKILWRRRRRFFDSFGVDFALR